MGGGASKMCGSQNVSEPKIAGQIAHLLRLGLNRREVCVCVCDTCHSTVLLLSLLLLFTASSSTIMSIFVSCCCCCCALTARFLGLTKRCVFGRR